MFLKNHKFCSLWTLKPLISSIFTSIGNRNIFLLNLPSS